MTTAGYRNVDGELLVAAAIMRECGHRRAQDIGPMRFLLSYRSDLVGTQERCEQCPGYRKPAPYRTAEVHPYRRIVAVELWQS